MQLETPGSSLVCLGSSRIQLQHGRSRDQTQGIRLAGHDFFLIGSVVAIAGSGVSGIKIRRIGVGEIDRIAAASITMHCKPGWPQHRRRYAARMQYGAVRLDA